MNLFIRLFGIKDKNALKLLLVWILVLSILYSTLALLRHNHFQSGAFDLGIFDQAVWQYSNFEFPYNTIKERFILGDHFTITLPLLAPLFYLWNDVKILLIFQAVFITFSTLGIYKIATYRKLSPFVSLIIASVYSLFYGIQTAVSFDFHPIVIAVGILVWVAYFFETKKWKFFYPTLVLLLLTQENTGISLAGLGLIYLFHKEYRKPALLFIFGGIGVSLAETKIIGMMSPVGYQYTPQLPQNITQFVTGFFDSPEKIENWKYTLVPYDFLPLLSPGAMLAILLDLAQYYLTGFSRMWTPFQHHRAILAVFVGLGTIDAFIFLKNKKVNLNYLALLLLFTALLSQYIFHFPINKLSKKDYWKNESWMDNNKALFKLIPPNAGVVAPQNLVPHIAHRNKIYLAWPRQHSEKEKLCEKEGCWWLDFVGRPDYLVVDMHPGQTLTQILESNENFQEAVQNMEKNGKITLKKNVGDARLYKINY